MCTVQEVVIRISDGSVCRWKLMMSSVTGRSEFVSFWRIEVDEWIMKLDCRKPVSSGGGYSCFATYEEAEEYLQHLTKVATPATKWGNEVLLRLGKTVIKKYKIPPGSAYYDGRVESSCVGGGLPMSSADSLVNP